MSITESHRKVAAEIQQELHEKVSQELLEQMTKTNTLKNYTWVPLRWGTRRNKSDLKLGIFVRADVLWESLDPRPIHWYLTVMGWDIQIAGRPFDPHQA